MKGVDRDSRGFSLVELALSLGVAAFCLIAVFGLLPVGIQSQRNATSQTAAAGIIASVEADLRATPPTTPNRGVATTSVQYQIPIPANPVTSATTPSALFFTQEGTFSTTAQAQSRYRVTITFLPNDPGAAPARTATRAYIRITWPAAADPNVAAGSSETFATFDRN